MTLGFGKCVWLAVTRATATLCRATGAQKIVGKILPRITSPRYRTCGDVEVIDISLVRRSRTERESTRRQSFFLACRCCCCIIGHGSSGVHSYVRTLEPVNRLLLIHLELPRPFSHRRAILHSGSSADMTCALDRTCYEKSGEWERAYRYRRPARERPPALPIQKYTPWPFIDPRPPSHRTRVIRAHV